MIGLVCWGVISIMSLIWSQSGLVCSVSYNCVILCCSRPLPERKSSLCSVPWPWNRHVRQNKTLLSKVVCTASSTILSKHSRKCFWVEKRIVSVCVNVQIVFNALNYSTAVGSWIQERHTLGVTFEFMEIVLWAISATRSGANLLPPWMCYLTL